MTLFEYLAVSVSIVLSFGVIRMLDGIPQAFASGRRYWVHSLWVVNLLWMHVQLWWAFWSYSVRTSWNYPRFLIVLLGPALLYSLAITLVPRDAADVPSWSAHFKLVRVRFHILFALLVCSLVLSTWLVLGLPFLSQLRAWQAFLIGLFVVGARFPSNRIQGAVAIAYLAMLAYSAVGGFFEPAPLLPDG